MTRGRSITAYERLYIGGYDMSGYTIDVGERGIEYGVGETLCLSDAVKGVLAGQPVISFGPVNGVFDNTATSGIHVLANAAAGTRRYIMHARGVLAEPAIADDVFCASMYQTAYKATAGDETVTCNLAFGYDSAIAINYRQHWGALLHTFSSATAANSATVAAVAGAASSAGGWLMYQVNSITGAGTVTISVDDSADGTTYSALSGATSGEIATASAPVAGIVQLATTADVRQYLRWQIAFGGSAAACTFALAFMRG